MTNRTLVSEKSVTCVGSVKKLPKIVFSRINLQFRTKAKETSCKRSDYTEKNTI